MSTAFDEFLQEIELERQESEQKARSERLEEFVLLLLEEGWPIAKISEKMKEPIELVKSIQQKLIQQGLLPT